MLISDLVEVIPNDLGVDTSTMLPAVQPGAQDCILTLDATRCIVGMNRAAEALIGQAVRSAKGVPLRMFQPKLASEIEKGYHEPDTIHEIRWNQGDAESVFEMCFSRLTGDDDEACQYIVVLRNISERLIYEEQLLHSEAYYRVLTENSTDLIIIVSGDGTILYVSSALERIVGRASQAVVGTNALEFFHPADGDKLMASLAESLEAVNISSAFSARIRNQAGEWRVLECVANNLLDNLALKGIVINARDITERKKAEDQVKASLLEKEILLKEIHHRVKNNLQIICSLLNLQSNTIDDPQSLAQFQDSQNRIRSMALIHERLYRSNDLGSIDFGAYLSDLAASLVQAYRRQAQNTRLEVQADSVMLDIDTAIPCGLIVNELVSNALKHAFPDGRSGMVGIELRDAPDSDHYRLVVWDDGIGIAADRIDQFSSSLGLQLVHSLAHQLDGSVDLSNGTGTRLEIKFARKLAKEV